MKPVLNADQRGEALRLAEATGVADGAGDAERGLVDQLCAGLSG